MTKKLLSSFLSFFCKRKREKKKVTKKKREKENFTKLKFEYRKKKMRFKRP